MYRPDSVSSPYARQAVTSSVMGQVLGLLGFSFAFTAVGAYASTKLGPTGFVVGLIASIVAFIGLMIARERTPLNLILLYTFTTAEGILLGGILERYIQAGLGGAVISAAGTTALVTLVAGGYGVVTRRNLSGLRSVLTIGLFALLAAMLVGFFVHLPGLQFAISVVGALVFTGFITIDLQRLSRTRAATEGQAIMLAISIYLDIVNLFLFLLRLFGNGRD